jgi:hypothetical protein
MLLFETACSARTVEKRAKKVRITSAPGCASTVAGGGKGRAVWTYSSFTAFFSSRWRATHLPVERKAKEILECETGD